MVKLNPILTSILLIIVFDIIDTTIGFDQRFKEVIIHSNDSDLLTAIKTLEHEMNNRLLFTNYYYKVSKITWAFGHRMNRYKFIRYYLYFQLSKTDCRNKRTLIETEHCKFIREKQPFTAYAEISKNINKNRFRLMVFKAKRGKKNLKKN